MAANWRARLIEWLGLLSRPASLVIGAVLVAGLALIQFSTGPEISFSIFYLVPVLYATWFIGRRWGILFAVACAATWGLVDLAAGAVFSSIWIPAWNSAVRMSRQPGPG